jgi:general secretion pathway protein F
MSSTELQILTDRELEQMLAPPESGPPAPRREPPRENPRGIGTKALCRFVHQLSTLLRAGMPLVPALSALVEQMQCPISAKSKPRQAAKDSLAAIVEHMRNDVNEGSSLAEALGRYPGLFSPLFINMVAAGETSGALEETLTRLADMLEKRVQLLGKIRSALVYPAVMALVAAGVITFLLSYVVPNITQLFVKMNHELPLPTRLLMAISANMQTCFLLTLLVPCVAAGAIYGLCQTREGKRRMHRVALALPLVGPLLLKLEVARLTRTWGACMKSGIPVTAAIEIARRVVQNQVVADAVDQIKVLIHKGQTIAAAVKATGMFPPVVVHLIATGQMTGAVENAMTDVAEMYEAEVETSVKTFTVLLEPLILLAMGAVVGFIVLAVLLPIFEINQTL